MYNVKEEEQKCSCLVDNVILRRFGFDDDDEICLRMESKRFIFRDKSRFGSFGVG